MSKIKKYFLKRSLIRFSKKPAPRTIPLSQPGSLTRNYYEVWLTKDSEKIEYLAKDFQDNIISALKFTNNPPPSDVELSLADMMDCSFLVRYYLGRYEYQYESPIWFELASILNIPKLLAIWYDFRQWLYNKQSLATIDRVKVLQHLVEQTIDNPDKKFTVLRVMEEFFGNKMIYHSNFKARQAYYQLIFESLIKEDLISFADNQYKITPKALTTLQAFEDEKSRHVAATRIQIILIILTLVSAIGASVQAYYASIQSP